MASERFWTIPARIVQRRAAVTVKAFTKREAIEKFRRREWEESNDDPDGYIVTKVGSCTPQEEV